MKKSTALVGSPKEGDSEDGVSTNNKSRNGKSTDYQIGEQKLYKLVNILLTKTGGNEKH